MKKYPILIALIGLMGVSITRLYSASVFDWYKKTAAPNPITFMGPIEAEFNKLNIQYDNLLRQYKAATNPTMKEAINKEMAPVKAKLDALKLKYRR